MAGAGEVADHGDHAVVRAHEPVVMLELKLAIASDEPVDLGLVADELAEGVDERPPDQRAPFVVGRRASFVALEGVAHRAQDQLDRVDQRAVEVEQQGGGRHVRIIASCGNA